MRLSPKFTPIYLNLGFLREFVSEKSQLKRRRGALKILDFSLRDRSHLSAHLSRVNIQGTSAYQSTEFKQCECILEGMRSILSVFTVKTQNSNILLYSRAPVYYAFQTIDPGSPVGTTVTCHSINSLKTPAD